MAKKMRKTPEEEILAILKKEGFKEIPQREIKKEPYKSIYNLPECMVERKPACQRKRKVA
ncbi:MAG: hypothetical protein CO103_07885 [Chloroflexi bacterium CG_4_9_14_3_um_filter_45_9]|nr:MAG: hypothetical protein CO103_07885 [Chloroflexi bacterium CG_4_9_14_3_um_filter_45_9]